MAWLFGVVEALAGVLGVIWLLFWPPLHALYYSVTDFPSEREADALTVVRWVQGDAPAAVLNSGLQGGKFSRKELNHYRDVRAWVDRIPLAVTGLGLSMAWIGWMNSDRRRLIASAQVRGVFFLGIASAFSGFFAVWDWKVFFAWLHLPFFGTTSWRFSNSAYSLQLFPAEFWQWMTVASAVVPLVSMAVIWTFVSKRGAFRSWNRPTTEGRAPTGFSLKAAVQSRMHANKGE